MSFQLTIVPLPGPTTDPRAAELLNEYRTLYGGPDLPVPVEAIAEHPLGLIVIEDEEMECSGMRLPAAR